MAARARSLTISIAPLRARRSRRAQALGGNVINLTTGNLDALAGHVTIAGGGANTVQVNDGSKSTTLTYTVTELHRLPRWFRRLDVQRPRRPYPQRRQRHGYL